MLASYNATIASADTYQILFTVAAGKELLVAAFQISAGQQAATVTFTKNDGSSDVFSESYTLSAGDMLALDAKKAFPAGYVWKVKSDAAGVQVDVCANITSV